MLEKEIALAATLNKLYRYPLAVYWDMDDKPIYAFCQIDTHQKTYYIDSHGITDSILEFVKHLPDNYNPVTCHTTISSHPTNNLLPYIDNSIVFEDTRLSQYAKMP